MFLTSARNVRILPTMSELGNKVREFRGELSQEAFANQLKISHRTLVKVEGGERVKLKTVADIAKGLGLSEPATLDLVASWCRLHLGDFADKLFIDPKSRDQLMKEKDHLPSQLMMHITKLPVRHQQELLKAVKRPEVLEVLADTNAMYDRLAKSK